MRVFEYIFFKLYLPMLACVNMNVCVYMCGVCVYVRMCVCVYVYICEWVYMCVCVCTSIGVYICVCVLVPVHVYIWAYTYIFLYFFQSIHYFSLYSDMHVCLCTENSILYLNYTKKYFIIDINLIYLIYALIHICIYHIT